MFCTPWSSATLTSTPGGTGRKKSTLKGLGHQTNIFLKDYKIKSVLVSMFLGCPIEDKNKCKDFA
jgi:hypothetical protein